MAKKKDAFGASVSATINTQLHPSVRRPQVQNNRGVGDAFNSRPAKILEVPASECYLWEYHNRREPLSEESCRDLIDGIIAQAGIEFPLIVRDKKCATGQRFEIICGARRFFSVHWLNSNNYPNIKLKIEIRVLTDEEAFRLADVENGPREDISPYERGQDYKRALRDYYENNQTKMAKRREISQQDISYHLKVAELPEWILDAYHRWSDLKLHHASPLLDAINNPGADVKLKEAVQALGLTHRENRLEKRKPMSGAQVLAKLLSTAKVNVPVKKAKKLPLKDYEAEGRGTVLTVRAKNKAALQLSINLTAGATRSELISVFRQALDDYA